MVRDLGLLTARLTLGLGLAAHGAQKAFGWFEGAGPQGAAGMMESLGLKPGPTYATAASANEITAGLLIALGLGGPLGPAAVISTMSVAARTVHLKNGFFAAKSGVELPLLYAVGALAFASSGYGALSFDRVLGLDAKLRHPVITALALAGGVAAAETILAQRDFSPPEGTLATPTIKGEHNGQQAGTKPSPATS